MNMKMGSILAIAAAILLLISSCSNVATSTNNNIESTEIIKTPTSTPTILSTPVPTKTAQTPLPTQNIVNFQPFEITSEGQLEAKPMGALVTCSDSTIQLLRFTPEVSTETIPGIADEIFCLATSPDGKWIAYEQDSKDSPTGSWLIVQPVDEQQQTRIPMDPDWRSFGDYLWLDNQRLIFNNFINLPDVQRVRDNPAYSMVVVNPFTGEQIELSSDYPGLGLGVSGPAGRIAFNYSDVVYDPSLNLAIFPAWDGDAYIILWDRQTNSVLAKVNGDDGYYPLWSPDAEEFVVPLRYPKDNRNIIGEWFLVNRDGNVEQLTHFGEYFSESRFGSGYNWSPDGKKLAFWVDLTPSPCPELRLAILDMDTKQITNTCLPGLSYWAPPPIWSLDNRYILVMDATATPIKKILVDIDNGQASDITTLVGESAPIGWLVSP